MERHLEQTDSYVAPYPSHRGSDILITICLLTFLSLVAYGFIANFSQFRAAAFVLACAFLALIVVIIGYLLWYKWYVDHLNLQAKTDEVTRLQEKHTLELYLSETRLHADPNGNRPFIYDRGTTTVLEVASGNYMQPVPHHVHHEFNYNSSQLASEAQAMLTQAIPQPSQDWLLSQLPDNQLIVSPGVQLSDGKVVQVSMIDVPHFKVLGASGFGKSCLAGSLLDQACETNTPNIFQMALLDLEHKTSRLFEDRPHVAHVRIGNRLVQMVATTADEVVEYLGYLTKELDRRAVLSEAELARLPILFMYVEEMLSLQYEVIDTKLLQQMFAALTILSVRGRKYGMFLLACMQTDYSTNELKVSQKMFRFRAAAAIDPSAARSAGFQNTELVKQNFQQGKPGQFVIEYPSFSQIVLAPVYDVKRLIGQKTRVQEDVQEDDWETPRTVSAPPLNHSTNGHERALEANGTEVQRLKALDWGKQAIIEKVWRVKKGGSLRYKQAEAEYEHIIAQCEKE